MTLATLKSCSHKDLIQMARKGGVRGWHQMRKEQLVKALLAAAKSKGRKPPQAATPTRRSTTSTKSSPTKKPTVKKVARPAVRAAKPTNPRVAEHLRVAKAKQQRNKSVATELLVKKTARPIRDRILVMVRDSYWLHAYWELTQASIARIQAAMNANWHLARPVLRLLEVAEGGTTSASEQVVQDVEIHGGVNNWYIHVDDPPKSYRVEIGYLAGDRFYGLARSNVVTTPQPGSSDAIDEHWTDVARDSEKIFAMSGGYSPDGSSTELQELFEERLRRPMGSPMTTRYGHATDLLFPTSKDFEFEVDAELIVYGVCQSNAHVTVRGEPVKLRPDGTFTLRMNLPNQRQVIPAVACTRDGSEQRTIVLAIERNTKVMEPVIREADE